MIKFSEQLKEAKVEDFILKLSVAQKYYKEIKGLPRGIKYVLNVLIQHNFMSKLDVELLVQANKTELNKLSIKYNIPISELTECQKILKQNEESIKLLPMLQTEEEIEGLMNGNKSIEDITIDLVSEKGRSKVAKDYAKLVIAIASKYKQAGLDFNSLVSAGMTGLVHAMNTYKNPDYYTDLEDSNPAETKKYKKLSFKQYAGYCIRNFILIDLNKYSRTVHLPQNVYYANTQSGNTKGNFNSVYIDRMFGDDDDRGSKLDRMLNLSDKPDYDLDNEKLIDELKKILRKNFSERDCIVFFKTWGLAGYHPVKQVELAAELKLTKAMISIINSKIMKYISSTPKAKETLAALYNYQMECLCAKYYYKSKEELIDIFINNDDHIMLESIVRLNSKEDFNYIIGSALDNYNENTRNYIIECLESDFEFIDESYNNNKFIITDFLSNIYPTESFKKSSDIDILNRMAFISEKFKEHNL